MEEGKAQIGIFQGIEFAWERQKHADLLPLMLVINQQSYLRPCLVVRSDSGLVEFTQLKGKTLGQPEWSRMHCALFLESLCRKHGELKPATYFGRIRAAGESEEVLDNVADGTIDAALVEQVPLECYKRRKPARKERLQVLAQSELFPASVVAYRANALDRATLVRFREGMLRAHRSALGMQILTLWKLTGFVTVPVDYQEKLRSIVVSYPPKIRLASGQLLGR